MYYIRLYPVDASRLDTGGEFELESSEQQKDEQQKVEEETQATALKPLTDNKLSEKSSVNKKDD